MPKRSLFERTIIMVTVQNDIEVSSLCPDAFFDGGKWDQIQSLVKGIECPT